MSQSSSEKYLYFTVGLLKGSDALDALREDAVKHHMIDYPGQLIALRLTEYYEMMNQGITQPVIKVPAVIAPVETERSTNDEAATANERQNPPQYSAHLPSSFETPAASSVQATNSIPVTGVTGRMRAITRDDDGIVLTSRNADQNADDAADYWSML
jgi:hypothetical protein